VPQNETLVGKPDKSAATRRPERRLIVYDQVSLFAGTTSYVVEAEISVKKTLLNVRNIVGVAGLILAAYVLIISVPDVGRYIKISRM